MRLALCQINPTVGDLEGNAALITAFADRARAAGADMVVFPELALSGYPPRDLLIHDGFIEACVAAARRLGESASRSPNHSPKDQPSLLPPASGMGSKSLTLVFGCPLPVDPGSLATGAAWRKGVANSLLVYRDGKHIGFYDKRLLPTYDVFDEDRYFTPGARPVVIDVAGVRVGLSICEDLWRGEDVGFAGRYADAADPVAELVRTQPDGRPGAQLIINPSASPFVLGKGQRHRELLARHAAASGVHVASVNQVGGNDELIFDGHAAVYGPNGALVAAAPGFEEHMLVFDLDPASRRPTPLPSGDPLLLAGDEELVHRALVLGVRDYCRKTGFTTAVLGLSGGIDSAVCAVLAAAALGPKGVLGVSLPSRHSSEGSKTDAAELAARLGMGFTTIPIEDPVAGFERALAPAFAGLPPGVAEENLQSRARGTILMGLSNKLGHILLSTGNKSELAVGYCTLYGDMNGGLAVLSDLSKAWVYRLAHWMNANPDRLGILPPLARPPIPAATLTKPPSAELRPNQTDQDTLPPYDVLDEIIERYVERREHPSKIVEATGHDPTLIARIVRMIDVSEHKRKQSAVGLKVTGVAFGSGRRVPIAQRWRPERIIMPDRR